MKKRILCFGDSNTWGYMTSGGRFDEETRWPMRLEKLLGPEYTVIEEGFNGRTCVFDDPIEGGYKSGLTYLPPCVMSHSPLDLVILMLGTNDLKKRFGMTAFTIGRRSHGAGQGRPAARHERRGPAAEDPHRRAAACGGKHDGNPPRAHFGEDSIAVSRELGPELRRVAKLMRCEFLDAAPYGEVSRADAVHMTREGHLRLAKALCEKVLEILK